MGKETTQNTGTKKALENPHPNPKKKLVPKFAATTIAKPRRKAMYL